MSAKGQYRGIGLHLLDEEAFQALSEGARWTLVVLMVSIGPSGIERRYHDSLVSDLRIRTGSSERKVRSSLRELEAAGWVKREGALFWVVRQLELDPLLAATNDKHQKSIYRHLASLPRCPLTLEFVTRYPAWFPVDPWDAQGSATARLPDSLSVAQRSPIASGRREEGEGREGEARTEERPPSGEGAADAAPAVTPGQRKEFLRAGFAALAKSRGESEAESEYVRAGRRLDARARARERTTGQAALDAGRAWAERKTAEDVGVQ
jgi:hypothetical protein